MSLQVARKFGSFASLMLSHQIARFRLGRFRVQSQSVTADKRLSLNRAFSFIKYWSLINKAVGAVFAATKKRYALTDKPARELADGITGTEQNGDVRVAYEKALWKSKSDLMGAIVPTRLSMTGMVGSGYITCLACPMGKYNQQGIL